MEKTIKSRRAFEGRLLKVDVLEVELPDGRRTVREIVRHPGAAVILAQLPDERFVFVRQYRKAAESCLLEAVAGTLDPGETAETCAARELTEETGFRAETLQPLGTAFPAPGYTDELHHFFFARLHGEQGEDAPDADEDVECIYLTRHEVEQKMAAGAIRDGKTLAAWLLYQQGQRS